MSARQQHALAELRAALVCNAGRVAETLLGEPNPRLSSRRTLRFGSNGSVAVEISGAKAGLYFNHESGDGGDLLDLIQRTLRLTFGEAVAWAEAATGTSSSAARVAISPASLQRELAEREAARQAAAALQDASAIARAAAIWGETVPVAAGSPGDIYLTTTRGIPRPTAGWPGVVRWHPARRALVFGGTTPAGELQAIQLIYVTPAGEKVGEAELAQRGIPAVKQTRGRRGGGAVVRLPGARAAGPLLLTEGPEDALGAWIATGAEVWITLGPIGAEHVAQQLPAGRPIVVCRDGDLPDAKATESLDAAIVRWREAGHDVRESYGRDDRAAGKYDFNDLLRDQGLGAVRARMDAAIWLGAPPPKRIPVREVSEVLAPLLADFFDRAFVFDPDVAAAEGRPPEVMAIRVDAGGGKTRTARQEVIRARLRAGIEARQCTRQKAFVALPRHDLIAEQVDDILAEPEFAASGLRIAVKLGRERPDPLDPTHDMCRAPDRIRDARGIGERIESAACRKRLPDGTVAECPFFRTCGTQRQMAELQAADIVLLPHNDLTNDRPAYLGKGGVLIADEDVVKAFLEGFDGQPIGLALDALERPFEVHGDVDATGELRFILLRLRGALLGVQDGRLPRSCLTGHVTGGELRTARTLLFMAMAKPGLHPALSDNDWRDRVEGAAINKIILRLTGFLRALADFLADGEAELSGRVSIESHITSEGEPVRSLRRVGRRPLGEGWSIPTMVMDATMQPSLLREIWPQLHVGADVSIAAPHERVIRYLGRSFATSQYIARSKKDESTCRENRADLRIKITLVARGYRGRVLVVLPKKLRKLYEAEGGWPANICWGHHGGLDGSNEFRDVDAIIVVGRSEPKPVVVEAMAGAWTGRAPVAVEGDRYPKVSVGQEMACGYAVPIEVHRHPDPIAEAFRWRAAEGGIIQVAARPRGVWRSADKPVEVHLMNELAVPFPVAEVVEWSRPVPAELMLYDAGIALQSSSHAAVAFRHLWPDPEMAKSAWRLRRLGSNSSSTVMRGKRPPPRGGLLHVRYKRAGSGQKLAEALVDLAIVPNPRAWLEERLGQLVAFSVVAGTEAPAAAPEPVSSCDETSDAVSDAVPDQTASEPAAEPLPAADGPQADAPAVEQIKVSARPWPSLMMSIAPPALSGFQAAIAHRALGLPPARAGP